MSRTASNGAAASKRGGGPAAGRQRCGAYSGWRTGAASTPSWITGASTPPPRPPTPHHPADRAGARRRVCARAREAGAEPPRRPYTAFAPARWWRTGTPKRGETVGAGGGGTGGCPRRRARSGPRADRPAGPGGRGRKTGAACVGAGGGPGTRCGPSTGDTGCEKLWTCLQFPISNTPPAVAPGRGQGRGAGQARERGEDGALHTEK